MADTGGALERDAFYLDATAREFGWQVVWEPGASVMMSKGIWTVLVLFDLGGRFRSGRVLGPGTAVTELTLQQTVDALEHWGTR
jgi:hypothetical protein